MTMFILKIKLKLRRKSLVYFLGQITKMNTVIFCRIILLMYYKFHELFSTSVGEIKFSNLGPRAYQVSGAY